MKEGGNTLAGRRLKTLVGGWSRKAFHHYAWRGGVWIFPVKRRYSIWFKEDGDLESTNNLLRRKKIRERKTTRNGKEEPFLERSSNSNRPTISGNFRLGKRRKRAFTRRPPAKGEIAPHD